jgi:hypothetical protein
MTPEEVVDTCAAMGICLRVEAGKLKAAPPPAPPLLAKLRLHRDAVIARLEGLPPMTPMGSPHPRGASAQCNTGGRFARSSGKRMGGIGVTPHILADPAASAQLDPPMPPIDLPEPAEKCSPPRAALSAQRRAQPDISVPEGGLEPQARVAHPWSCPLPDPVNLAERAAILETNGAPREAAETQALQEAGFPSWEAYAVALAAQLTSKIEAAQAPSAGPLAHHWQALVRHSLSFLASPWWLLACQYGWALAEVFGVDCDAALVRVDGWGLAIAPALSSLPPTRLVELTCEGLLSQRNRGAASAGRASLAGGQSRRSPGGRWRRGCLHRLRRPRRSSGCLRGGSQSDDTIPV